MVHVEINHIRVILLHLTLQCIVPSAVRLTLLIWCSMQALAGQGHVVHAGSESYFGACVQA